jgi:hypothetical protein
MDPNAFQLSPECEAEMKATRMKKRVFELLSKTLAEPRQGWVLYLPVVHDGTCLAAGGGANHMDALLSVGAIMSRKLHGSTVTCKLSSSGHVLSCHSSHAAALTVTVHLQGALASHPLPAYARGCGGAGGTCERRKSGEDAA